MTTLAITPSSAAAPASRNAPAPRWRAVLAVGLVWYGAFALLLFGDALGLL